MNILLVSIIIISLAAFGSPALFKALLLSPWRIIKQGQIYRLVTSGFIHAGFVHLLFNLLALYTFGRIFSDKIFLIIFTAALLISSLVTVIYYSRDSSYQAVGASGGAMGIIFCAIVLQPHARVLVLFFPMPGWLFGILFLVYSIYASRQHNSNIGHIAHISGALTGLAAGLLLL
ncbi:MAG TPA: rhomboid family intramembrane serine protease [Spirochaetota bacterium]|nr:rhomboid family intramembrane serine protease [Spirochaetota bacterium]